MPSEHNRLDSLGSTIASFVIWCLSIPLNAIPIYLKYLTDKSTTLSPCHYILADKECTFIFVAVGFMLLLEGGYFFYKGKRWENIVSWIIRIFTVVFIITLILTYIPNAINEVAWEKNQEYQLLINTCFLVTTLSLGLFGHIFICARKMMGDN